MLDFRSGHEQKSSAFDFISIRIASPEEIRGPRDPKERERLELAGQRAWWSWGEVTRPETINYRAFKPEKDGLFCERIFGPVKDWECHCGKYKRIRYRGVICDRCGVEVTLSKVRRERMGHIELCVPVAHIWFLMVRPYIMPSLLGITLRELERVIYYSSYIVIEPGNQCVASRQVLTEDECLTLRAKARDEGDRAFEADIGASAVRKLLLRIDIVSLATTLPRKTLDAPSRATKVKLLRQLRAVEAFLGSGDSGDLPNKLEWMILDVVPVIPPDLRPLVPLDGGRFATHDLNDLYRRVINRNNRLQKLIQHRAPEVILRNEKRMLQEAVDALFDNGRRSKAIRGRGKRPLKSLSDMLKGKQGRFRQNLLGKRVDYSGRSVIVVGPELRLHQCGLPKAMAVELFKPFIIHKLVEKGIAETVKRAKKIVERESPEVCEILEEIIQDHPVLLNRAPTLHRLGIQAFEPVLVEGKAIRIHPLVCAAFNADFDGDQMAVHVPLSFEAQIEARVLMLSANNLLRDADGSPAMTPTRDVALGCHWLTSLPRGFDAALRDAPVTRQEEVKQCLWKDARHFGTLAEIEMALLTGSTSYHSAIWFWYEPPRDAVEPQARWVQSTVGRVMFNSILPRHVAAQLGFRDEPMSKMELSLLVAESYRRAGLSETVSFLDRLKELGFRFATVAGVSIGIEDLEIPADRAAILADADQRVTRFQRAYHAGEIGRQECFSRAHYVWTRATSDAADAMMDSLRTSQGGLNPVYLMSASGAGTSLPKLRRLVTMVGMLELPGQMAACALPDRPVGRSLREGLNPIEMARLARTSRRRLADREAGAAAGVYLMRRLHAALGDITITEDDCGTVRGVEIVGDATDAHTHQTLGERVLGFVAAHSILEQSQVDGVGDPRVLVNAGDLIDELASNAIDEQFIDTILIRSVLTCETGRGVCRMCYGQNLSTQGMVDLGEPVGVRAVQACAEPLVQGAFDVKTSADDGRAAAPSLCLSWTDGIVRYTPGLKWADVLAELPNATRVTRRVVLSREERSAAMMGEGLLVVDPRDRARVIARYGVPAGAILFAREGEEVRRGTSRLYARNRYARPIILQGDGELRWKDLLPGVTLRKEYDKNTGLFAMVVGSDPGGELYPSALVYSPGRADPSEYPLPEGSRILLGSPSDAVSRACSIPEEANPWSDRFAPAWAYERQIWPGRWSMTREGSWVTPPFPVRAGVAVVVSPVVEDVATPLDRVISLLEARTPKNAAVLSDVTGLVTYGEVRHGKRDILVHSEPAGDGGSEANVLAVPAGAPLCVFEGERISAGDRITEGPVNPHDILRIKGPHAVHAYILEELRKVYRRLGAPMSDKHLSLIVRQMLQKVRVIDPGDTQLARGEHVEKAEFRSANEYIKNHRGESADAEPVLESITKAGLTTPSFLAAAAFREATGVLTDAAIRGAKDDLLGLRENVMIGHLIPAGSGIYRYAEIELEPPVGYEPPPPPPAEEVAVPGAPLEGALADEDI